MIQRAVVYFCLLFLCIGMPIQAGTLSGDGVSAGQTKVTAQVAAADGTLPGEDVGSGVDVNEGISTDDPSQAGACRMWRTLREAHHGPRACVRL